MKNILLVLLILLNIQSAFACFEDFPISEGEGEVILAEPPPLEEGPAYVHFRSSFEHTVLDSELVFLYHPSNIASYNFKKLTHIGILLAQYGLFNESLEVFKRLYQEHPNEYAVIIGLGTIHELVGQLEEAKLLIEKAMMMKPNAHNRSEWVHVKILEAKMALKKDANWLLTHSVLNISKTKIDSDDSAKYYLFRDSLDVISNYLNEMFPFEPTPNFLIANILNEIGDACQVKRIEPDAYSYYLVALAYDPQDRYQLKAKLKVLKPRLESYSSWRYHIKPPSLEQIFKEKPTDNSAFQAAFYAKKKDILYKSKVFVWGLIGLLSIGVLITFRRFLPNIQR